MLHLHARNGLLSTGLGKDTHTHREALEMNCSLPGPISRVRCVMGVGGCSWAFSLPVYGIRYSNQLMIPRDRVQNLI